VLFLRQIFTVTAKDLRSEFRTKEALNASLSFALVILLLFSFAFDPTSDITREISGGLLWLVFAFAGALILNRSFARELVNDCMDMLLASPVPAPALFLGKTLANYILLLGIELCCLPVFGLFYRATWWERPLWLGGVFLLATWGISVVGTLFSALTVNLRLRELMLPMLVYPMLIPCLMAAMHLTTPILAGDPMTGDVLAWMRLLLAFDIIFTSLSVMLIDTILIG